MIDGVIALFAYSGVRGSQDGRDRKDREMAGYGQKSRF